MAIQMPALPLHMLLRLLLVFALLAGARSAWSATPLTICNEPGDGMPWMYWAHASSQDGPRELRGFSVDLWTVVFHRLQREVRMVGDMPWKRCMRAVASGEIDFATGAYRDDERAKQFVYSRPYKVLTPQVFFRANKPVLIVTKADLKKYRGCGMNGSSYAHYGLKAEELDLGARSYRNLIEKLLRGRCDYFVEELEVIQQLEGGRRHDLDDPALGHAPVPDAEAPALHLIAARDSAAAALMPQIDAAVTEFYRSGEAMKLWKKHAGNLPY